ncbi:helix-turn-helix domain-containing protein [Emticicia sp. SJ17W-69]|uniref:helix-turn-helix domain-containing protein n=1 Tax=Emticicia sp. SJ17W-69 TaxID=3421657 RepID=UPI003EB92592
MLENNLNKVVPTIDTQQLEKVLLDDGVPVAELNRYSNKYFHINRLEEYHKIGGHSLKSDSQPRRINIYSFFFLTKGKSIRSNGLDTYEFGENTFYFIPAYQITIFNSSLKDVEGYYCHFSLELLTRETPLQDVLQEFPFLQFNSYPLVKISEKARKNSENVLDRLIQEYNADEDCRIDILSVYLKALFSELKPFVEISKPITTNAMNKITEQYKKALANNISEKFKISAYAEMLNVTPNHLNKCVKMTTNKSAHDLLDDMLLIEAKVLLKQTNLNVTEISYKIGKNSLSDFTRFFKSKTGLPPSEYRISKI